jgi:hypothetical protein
MLEQGGLYCKRCGRRVIKPTNKKGSSKGTKRNENAEPSKKVHEHQKKPFLAAQEFPKPSIQTPPDIEPQPQNGKQLKERKLVSRLPRLVDHSNGNQVPTKLKKMEHVVQQPQPHNHEAPSPKKQKKKKIEQLSEPQLNDQIAPKSSAARPLKNPPPPTISDQRKILQTDPTPDEQHSPNSNNSVPAKPTAARPPNNLPLPKKSQITIPFPCSLVGNEQKSQAAKRNDDPTSGDCGYLGHYYKANPKGKLAQPPPLPLEVMSPPKLQPESSKSTNQKNPQSQDHATEEKRNSLPVLNHKHSMPQEGKVRSQEKHRMESTRSAPPRIKEREGEKLSLPPPVRRSHDYENSLQETPPPVAADLTRNNKIRMKGNQPKRKRSSL